MVLTDKADNKVCLDAVKFVYKNSYTDLVIDNQDGGCVVAGSWWYGSSTQDYGVDYGIANAGTGSNKATFTPSIPGAGNYEVFVWYTSGTTRATNAPYTINHMSGSTTVSVNQQVNGGQWVSIGTYSFAAGTTGTVVLTDKADNKVCLDAVKFVYK